MHHADEEINWGTSCAAQPSTVICAVTSHMHCSHENDHYVSLPYTHFQIMLRQVLGLQLQVMVNKMKPKHDAQQPQAKYPRQQG